MNASPDLSYHASAQAAARSVLAKAASPVARWNQPSASGLSLSAACRATDAQAQPFQDAATILIDGFRRDILFGGVMRSTALDQHEKTPGTMRLTTIRPAPAEFYFTQNYMSW